MSKANNVNPDHYKVAGRERPGNAVAKAPKATANRVGAPRRAGQQKKSTRTHR
jgi:hypothetical protein